MTYYAMPDVLDGLAVQAQRWAEEMPEPPETASTSHCEWTTNTVTWPLAA